jgi:hypothetical protein
MAVDMQIHLLDFEPEYLRIFDADCHGWDPERPGKVILQHGINDIINGREEVIPEWKYENAKRAVELSPAVWIGRYGGSPVGSPYAVVKMFQLFGGFRKDGEDPKVTVITDKVIAEAEKIFNDHPIMNEADKFYTVNEGEKVLKFLREHKGRKAFRECW